MNIFDFYQVSPGEKRMPISIQAGRDSLPFLFRELGYTVGAEIGIERGEYSEALCRANPDLLLHCVDPWIAYKGYREHVTQRKLDEMYIETVHRLKSYKVRLMRYTSELAAREFQDGELDFVYIDGNHDFLHVAQDICLWSQKVRQGGIVAGHDFKRFRSPYVNCVKDVVQAYAYAHGIRPWFVLRGDGSPSWFWVKP